MSAMGQKQTFGSSRTNVRLVGPSIRERTVCSGNLQPPYSRCDNSLGLKARGLIVVAVFPDCIVAFDHVFDVGPIFRDLRLSPTLWPGQPRRV